LAPPRYETHLAAVKFGGYGDQMPRRARKPEGRYHHGELRRALLEEAAAVVERDGVAALSLRELARRLGVSHAAPAHHFADRAALLIELARDGFERFAAALEEAGAQARDPLDRLRRIGHAYVRFAIEHPGRFHVMFGPELSDAGGLPAALIEASDRSYQVVVAALETVLARWPAGRRPSTDAVAFTCWIIGHGAATLWLDGPVRRKAPPAEARALFEGRYATTLELLVSALAPPGARGRSRRTRQGRIP
jgi:AcrR family transcriptional regulator